MTNRRAGGPALAIALAISCAHRGGSVPAEHAREDAAAPVACPSGTRLRGAAPPTGDRVWCERDDGSLHGPVAQWFRGGQRRLTGEYRDGSKHGTWSSAYASGKPRSEEHWRGGQPTGTWVTYFEDGTRSTESLHREDAAIAFRSYRPGGGKLRQGTYVGGREHGTWTEWDAAGVATTSQWQDGVRTGAAVVAVLGVPECDAYLAGYTRCIEEQAPEAPRTTMRDTRDAMVAAWRSALTDPRNRGAVIEGCKAANESARAATASMGCSW